MKQEFVNVEEEIKNILPDTLKKDLQENERICTTCHGLGVVAVNNIYGIENDPNPRVKGIHFPYNHVSLCFCPDCYNGVQNLCEFCGKPLPKTTTRCSCKGYMDNQKREDDKNREQTILDAQEVKPDDVDVFLYWEETARYFSGIEEFIDFCKNCPTAYGGIPKVLWVTKEVRIALDADSIIESACEELHEDAAENCNYYSLQKVLDKWCEEQSGTTTYYPCYKEYVKVKEEWFE